MQAGLEQALSRLPWRDKGVKLLFLIGDAPPHLDYGQTHTYVASARVAAERAIKIATIGASGLDTMGEVVWRQLAQYTLGPFVFLTYGESGDSEGSPSTVSHHVGSNWVAETLDAIVVRLVKTELAHYAPAGAPPREDYFVAGPSPRVPPDDVLDQLFAQAGKQLLDYCVQKVEDRTPTLLAPIRSPDRALAPAVEKLEARLLLALARVRELQLVETKDLGEVTRALAQQASLRYDEKKVVELGRLVPAKLAVLGQLDRAAGGRLELLIKLVRLETGEILSVSLLKVDEKLIARR